MSEPVKDKAESIRQRLRNLLRERGEDVQFGLQRYAIERFLYRLGVSAHRERFILKGAALFALWGGPVYRPTRDLDFTGYGSADKADVLAALREICLLSNPADELVFDPNTLSAEAIRDDSEYSGLRIRLEATLGTSRIPIQIDIGFGNAIEPSPQYAEYPTLLDDTPPRIRTYPPEAVVAEKLHSMVVLGERNSRYKDFYDLHVLAGQFRFDGERLARAIAATFERRSTPTDAALPTALTPRFFADEARAAQWRTYLARNGLPGAPADFDSVGELIRQFLGPVWSGLAGHVAFTSNWPPGGAWSSEDTESQMLTAVSVPASATRPQQQRSHKADIVTTAELEAQTAVPLRRFKPYPEYKDSGVEWLGKIPAQWEVNRLKYVASINDEALPEDTDPNLEISYVDIGNVDTVRGISAKEAFVFENAPSRARRIVRDGDVIVSTVRTYLRAIAPIRDPEPNLIVSTGFAVIRPKALETLFAAHALRAPYFVDRVVAESVGVSFPAINASEMACFSIAYPDAGKQRTIAAFLDREIAKVDAMVAKKERLIELLQEKRTALITQAVTKGLDPNVPMKDSGVEWLGEIPEHWDLVPVKYCTVRRGDAIKTGPFGSQLLSSDMNSDAAKVYNQRTVLDRDFEWGENYISKEKFQELGAFRVQPGDVLLTTRGTIGRCAIVPENAEVGILHPCLMRVHPNPDLISAEFLCLLIQDSFLVQTQLALASDATTIDVIYSETIKAVRVPCPPVKEQQAIVQFVDERISELDALVAKIRRGIDRLKEFRTALISAAVTGKIDVWEEAA
ncbi:MAG: nucleotidyl transferase AbiEii/AbiGii toxin family protein [Gammaproteobacteria bacterium]